jgi:excinuclease ABC subunit C
VVPQEIIADIPTDPGVYMFEDARGTIVYVGKAKSLRNRVRSYFSADHLAEAKTGSLMRDASNIRYIVVDNEREALALENNLIKRHKPRYNILLRDDKTYPYIKLTKEQYPRVYVTRRLRKDGSEYFGPYFPGNLAYRIVNFIHRHFLVPSCTVDLTREHPRPCLQYHIHRCLGPCVPGLTTIDAYSQAAADTRLFLEGRGGDLVKGLRARMAEASANEQFEQAAALRDLISTVGDLHERQKMAAAEGRDADVLGWHREGALAAVNLFHLRNGRMVDRREFFWEELPAADDALDVSEFFSSLIKQLYLDQPFIPSQIHVPVDFEESELLEEMLTEKRGSRVEILTPQRGPKKAFLELVEKNAEHSFEQRFRVHKPAARAIIESLQESLGLPEPPKRIECFDISHTQGVEQVASMVVWEDGKMRKSDYRKFIIKTVPGNDDFASMREVVGRRYHRLLEEKKPFPGLILIDGGVGQLHAAQDALEALGVINQPLASLAKKEELLFVPGQESEPIRLDRHSPVLHLVQMVRDEAHRFAVTFHRQRRGAARLASELLAIPGVGEKTARKLLEHFGSLEGVRQASEEDLAKVAGIKTAREIRAHWTPVANENATADERR